MSSRFLRFRARRTGWWVFSILIAGPALVLALLGLRAMRADRIEREQQMRDRQEQLTRLADAAIQTAVDRVAAQLDRLDVDSYGAPGHTTRTQDSEFPPFVLDSGDVLSFPLSRVYFGDIGRRPEFLRNPSALGPQDLQLVNQAQAMDAQHRDGEAIALYRQAARLARKTEIREGVGS